MAPRGDPHLTASPCTGPWAVRPASSSSSCHHCPEPHGWPWGAAAPSLGPLSATHQPHACSGLPPPGTSGGTAAAHALTRVQGNCAVTDPQQGPQATLTTDTVMAVSKQEPGHTRSTDMRPAAALQEQVPPTRAPWPWQHTYLAKAARFPRV